jgi:hypothetical protein
VPDTYTPHLNMTLCEIGASRDSWGAKWNSNLTTLDTMVFQASPIGMLADFAGPNAPSGWLIADGRAVSRTTYSALFAVIGGYYGAGDGTSTFNLPNLNGRSAVGPGTVIDEAGNSLSLSFTQRIGYIWGMIQQANLPNYNLVTDAQGGHNHGYWTVGGGAHSHTTDAQGLHNHGNPGTDPQGNHNHSADVQGDHSHTYTRTDIPGGAGGVIGSGFQVLFSSQATSVAGAHGHNISVNGQHQHNIYWDGNHAHNVYGVGDHSHAINWDGNHQHNVALGGGGQWFEVLNPIIVITKIIYAGQQAATMVAVAADVVPTTLEGRDELAAIREELAALRAILAPPVQQRRLSAPLRGPH